MNVTELIHLKNTHLMDWLPQGWDHCQRGSKDWCQAYLNSAHDYILALEAAMAQAPTPATVPSGWVMVPRKPTKEMADAAAYAHYGKKRVDETGIEGMSMTVSSIDYNFWQAFKRFWKGALSAAPALASPPPASEAVKVKLTKAEEDILKERSRQVAQEGWDAAHDDQHRDNELSRAAACYAIGNIGYWPWSLDWWKPTDRRRNLVKAAALIIAEIERLDRLSRTTEEEG